MPDSESLARKFKRIYSEFEYMGYTLHDPIGEKYDVERVDCDATITGDFSNNLKFVEVIKPIIYLTLSDNSKRLRLSKTVLEKYNIKDKVYMILEEDCVILKPVLKPRQRWDNEFRKMHKKGDDQLLIQDVFDEEVFHNY